MSCILVAGLFGVLAAIVGWIGSRVIEKLDATVIETKCCVQHDAHTHHRNNNMNEFRRDRIRCEIEQLATLRERLHRIRDDEDRVIAGGAGGSQEASDHLSQAASTILAAIGLLDKARNSSNKETK